jgi:hypothetical protein
MDPKTYLKAAMDGLKDFQYASVSALYEGLYGQGRPRMLLADEVGLGKTVVARGLIARLIQDRIAAGKRKPLKVTYICSNQVIARENLKKLNPFPKGFGQNQSVERIAYLAFVKKRAATTASGRWGTLLELNTLTPATSFEIGTGMGNKWERRAIFAVLHCDLRMRRRANGLKYLLRGKVKDMDAFKREMDSALENDIQPGLADRFIGKLKRATIPAGVTCIQDEFRSDHERNAYETIITFAEKLDGRSWSLSDACRYLVRMLRGLLIDCCLRHVDADVYILDEFQRFRDLIDEDSGKEQAEIARRIFGRGGSSRVLLLSATPFKAFTAHDESDRGEDHYKDFGKVLRFLLAREPEKITRYEEHRRSLHRQIMDLRAAAVAPPHGGHRDAVQEILRSVICRTERHTAAADSGALIEDVWKDPAQQIPFGPGDVSNFNATDRIARALGRLGIPVAKPVEYCKSAVFPLSFLDRYKFKELLKERLDHPDIRGTLMETSGAWLDFQEMDAYRWSIDNADGGPANARLSLLLRHAVGTHGAGLLWVPPSLPYHPLEDAFAGADGFSKTLLFSSWVMVPRMISTLVSYEVEKATVGNPATVESTESEVRTYFTPDGKRRHPIPLIRYARRTQRDQVHLANMSNFTLLYPSQALAACVDPIPNLRQGHTLGGLRMQAAASIRTLLESADLVHYITPDGEADRWYWAAPLLLDRSNASFREAAARWLATQRIDGGNAQEGEGADTAEGGETEEQTGAKGDHFRYLRECLEDPARIGLGAMPDGLADVLADLALGSPAIISLRGLGRMFPQEEAVSRMGHAYEIADQFSSLFNKPESIAAVRLSEKHQYYWRMVADYCASGCLQSVIDEYLHLLTGANVHVQDVVSQLKDAINLNAVTINADDRESFLGGTPRKLRCHYAVEFGSQRVETEQGKKRASSLREVFNSPFRPFVLSTTSIGQEGLDFHYYCRRIVHWNLPGNPVDLEQREGRINRYKSLVIRQQLAAKYRDALALEIISEGEDPWQRLFQIADVEERRGNRKCELVPYWHIDPKPSQAAEQHLKIERVIPLYPFSIDKTRLVHMLKTLAIYRLAFGQPRQAELVDHLLERNLSSEESAAAMRNLVIDLSPISYAESKGLNTDGTARH